MSPAETTPAFNPAAALRERFGFSAFRPGQEEVIGHLLAGRSAVAVFPTGAGKSLCYQLPALLLPGTAVVVSPLIALMKDQLDALVARGAAAARLDSTLDAEEYRRVMGDLRAGDLKLLYVAPERFVNERFREAIARVRVSLLAIDEAHCVSEWGHNFRPDYLKLAEHRRRLGVERVLALTATAPPRVLADVCDRFGIDPACAVATGFYRPNLTLLTAPVRGEERQALLVERLRSRPAGAGIVYVTLRRTAEEVAERLRGEGFEALVYHAGLPAEERARTQERFLASSSALVVATIAFGMGIDKPDLRYVYHYDLPKSLESFAQEIGRAGRDGAPAICEMLISGDGREVLRNFAHGDVPDAPAVHGLVEQVLGGHDRVVLDLHRLSVDLDIRSLVVRTLLTYLELDGFVAAGTPLYAAYRFKPLAPSEEILERFSGERRGFLRALIQQATKKRVWLEIDLEAAAAALRQPRLRLVRALDYLAELGLVELQASQVRHPYRVLKRPAGLDALADDLHRRTLEIEKRELARLDQVLELAGLADCRWNHLCAYFGETRREPCGHCTPCIEGAAPPLPEPRRVPVDEAVWSEALELRRDEPLFAQPRALARFLTGLPSPRLSRARLTSHRLFGALAEVPFATILERLSREAD